MRAAAAAAALPFALTLAACGGAPAPAGMEPGADPAPIGEMQEPGETLLRMSEINLYLHDPRPTDGTPRKPAMWIRAEEFQLTEDDVWRFRNAQATIHSEDEADPIHVEAEAGSFEEDERARLTGNVRARVSDMALRMESFTYENPREDAPGVAWTEEPVRVASPALALEASGMRFYPDTKRYELTEVRGSIRFEGSGS